MKINTKETRGMKFSGEVGAYAAQWEPLCCKLFPPGISFMPEFLQPLQPRPHPNTRRDGHVQPLTV